MGHRGHDRAWRNTQLRAIRAADEAAGNHRDPRQADGTVRGAANGGTAQDAERRAYFAPFEKLSGVRTLDFPGADINKV